MAPLELDRVETRGDDSLEVLDRVSQKYTGAPFPRRRWSSRVVYFIEPTLARYYKLPMSHTPNNV